MSVSWLPGVILVTWAESSSDSLPDEEDSGDMSLVD